VLDEPGRQLERIMLGMRLREGIPVDGLPAGEVESLVNDGLVEVVGGRVALTTRGRLLADAIVRRLTD
jgi:oxygen-independent coproporphyrinogen-3 oxidase